MRQRTPAQQLPCSSACPCGLLGDSNCIPGTLFISGGGRLSKALGEYQ